MQETICLKTITNMSTFNLNNVQRKKLPTGAELINCEVRDNNGDVIQATIWKTDKDGKVFPNFDSLSNGSIIEGNLWNKPGTTNWSIYPPKPVAGNSARSGGFGGGMGKVLMETKKENIAEFQAKKSQSIEQAQTRNEIMYARQSACELVSNHPAYKALDKNNVEHSIVHLFNFILKLSPENLTSDGKVPPDFHQVDNDMQGLDESFQRSVNNDEPF